MPAFRNRRDALARIEALRLQDAVALARKLKCFDLPKAWPKLPDSRGIDKAGFRRLLDRELSRPDHPLNWHKRAVAEALGRPRARTMYFTMRRNLWSWPEFLGLGPKARLILEIVIELARDEAFPWYVNVQAREVMKLARTNHATMAASVRDLQCLCVTRPARRIRLFDDRSGASPIVLAARMPNWPCRENNWGVDPNEPLQLIPQWVVRYRRGTPWNAGRAAWWINYDLLCSTKRVLSCFEVSLDTLAKPYESRNRRLATPSGITSEDAFKALERSIAKQGPLPKPGLRAPFWQGMEFESA